MEFSLGTTLQTVGIFSLYRKKIRTMAGAPPRTSCRGLSEQLEILPIACQYIALSLINFIISNQENFQLSTKNINAGNKHGLQ
jgi:hypothetical protein